MQSVYIRNIYKNNIIDTNKIKDKYKNKLLYIPAIGILNNNEKYKLSKIIFDNSKLFYGNNKLLKLNSNIYIQFEGDAKIMSNKWYIKNILKIIENYNKIFNIDNFNIYIKIIKKKKYNNKFTGGYSSYNAIELILYEELYKDKLILKQLIAHEILHLYFPSISLKYGICYNEGFLDYLSTILNFSKKNIFYLTNLKIQNYYYLKEPINKKFLKQEKPYFIGYMYGYIIDNNNIKIIINYIKKYLKKRKYMLIPWNNKNYINFINNLFINKLCKKLI